MMANFSLLAEFHKKEINSDPCRFSLSQKGMRQRGHLQAGLEKDK